MAAAPGLPHLIDGYRAREDVFTRSVGVLGLVALIEVVNAVRLEWRWWQNVLALAGGAALLVGSFVVVNLVRERRPCQRPDDVGAVELALFVVLPSHRVRRRRHPSRGDRRLAGRDRPRSSGHRPAPRARRGGDVGPAPRGRVRGPGAGFSFAVSMVTDAAYREDFFDEVVGQVRQALAVTVVLALRSG